jgi:hypothetical protein
MLMQNIESPLTISVDNMRESAHDSLFICEFQNKPPSATTKDMEMNMSERR